MSTLTVGKFTTAEGAESAEETLEALRKEGLIGVLAAAVARPACRPDRAPHEAAPRRLRRRGGMSAVPPRPTGSAR
ncbi:hypothetical protein [Streptomyces californicus]|uniref:hypothetical protein n=1 Tax=Streptomyces californicus TaxID=67351 RepID=UPI0037BB7F99